MHFRTVLLGRINPDYFNNKQLLGERINHALNYLKRDAALLEDSIWDKLLKKQVFWTEIFIKSKEISGLIRLRLHDEGLIIINLLPDCISANCHHLICLSVPLKACLVKKILESKKD